MGRPRLHPRRRNQRGHFPRYPRRRLRPPQFHLRPTRHRDHPRSHRRRLSLHRHFLQTPRHLHLRIPRSSLRTPHQTRLLFRLSPHQNPRQRLPDVRPRDPPRRSLGNHQKCPPQSLRIPLALRRRRRLPRLHHRHLYHFRWHQSRHLDRSPPSLPHVRGHVLCHVRPLECRRRLGGHQTRGLHPPRRCRSR